MDKYQVRLLEKKEIAQNTWAFYFEKPSSFAFLPGQFTTVAVQLKSGMTDSRDMTIASSPLDEAIAIVTKIGEQKSQFKQILQALPIGGEVALTKPVGGFILREEKPHIFLAGGIGITPFYSMLKFASKQNMSIPLSLFVSFSSKEEVIFFEELTHLENENLRVIYSLTDSSEEWKGQTGRISGEMIKKNIKNIQGTTFMIAGPVEMVDAMQTTLLKMEIPPDNIKIDYFTGY